MRVAEGCLLNVMSLCLQVAVGGEKQRQVSYAYFMAFISLLTNVELIKKIYLVASENNPKKEVTKGRLMQNSASLAFYCFSVRLVLDH